MNQHAQSTPLVFGVLNVTPDSFSDGGQFLNTDTAIARGRELRAQGAHIIDIGGESTKPGAQPVPRDTELARVLPVIRALAADGITVSIDTIHAATARASVAAGARVINDVSGGAADPEMYAVVRETGAQYVLGHWRGIPDPEHTKSQYSDVVAEVRSELSQLVQAALHAGVGPHQIVLDPGLGFDKTAAQGWQLLAGFSELRNLGYPILVGISRKRMLSELTESLPQPVHLDGASHAETRDLATAVCSALLAQAGAWGVRVHHVPATVQALAVAQQFQVPAPATKLVHRCGPPERQQPEQPLPSDRISLTGVEVFAHHGVFDFERRDGQKFLIDAELAVALNSAAHSDELVHTVHYGELAEALVDAAQRDPVDLIETLAERLAAVALNFAGVVQARITVHKPDAPITVPFGNVSVTVERRAHTGGHE